MISCRDLVKKKDQFTQSAHHNAYFDSQERENFLVWEGDTTPSPARSLRRSVYPYARDLVMSYRDLVKN